MFNKLLLTLLLLSLSLTSSADWLGGIHVFQLNSEDGDFEADVRGLALSLGRKLSITDKIDLVPELRLGTGLTSDTVSIVGADLDTELERLFSVATRVHYRLTEKLQLFTMPTYTNTEFTVSAKLFGQDLSATEDDWDLGLGIGASYSPHQRVSGDLIFEYYNGKTLFSLAARLAL